MNWFTTLWERLLSDTPSFFKKIIYFGLTLGSVGAGIYGVDEIQEVIVPAWLLSVANHLITVGAISAFIAKSTVKDPEQLAK